MTWDPEVMHEVPLYGEDSTAMTIPPAVDIAGTPISIGDVKGWVERHPRVIKALSALSGFLMIGDLAAASFVAGQGNPVVEKIKVAAGKEKVLIAGQLVHGGALVDEKMSRSVDCVQSFDPKKIPYIHESTDWRPLDLSYEDGDEPLVLFGELTSLPADGYDTVSNGIAVRYDDEANRYTVYDFVVQAMPDTFIKESEPAWGYVMGRRIETVSPKALRKGRRYTDNFRRVDLKIEDHWYDPMRREQMPLGIVATVSCDAVRTPKE